MGTGLLVGVMVGTGVIFTLIIGSGLLFYQSTLALDSDMPPHEPAVEVMQQSNAFVILCLFIAAGLLFIVGAAQRLSHSG